MGTQLPPLGTLMCGIRSGAQCPGFPKWVGPLAAAAEEPPNGVTVGSMALSDRQRVRKRKGGPQQVGRGALQCRMESLTVP